MMGVDVRRQFRIAMSRKLLGRRQWNTSPAKIRDKGMAVAMKVGKQTVLVLIRKAGAFQVKLHHLGRLAEFPTRSLERKQGGSRINVGFRRQPLPKLGNSE